MHQKANNIEQTVLAYLDVLKKKGIPLDQVYLFGSQAKGTARADSDIDLIIVSSAFSDMPSRKRWELLGDALAEVLLPIEALCYSPEEFALQKARQASFLQHVLNQPETQLLSPPL